MSGTPSFPGVSSFAVSVVDKRSASASQPYSVDIVAAEQPQPEPPSSFPVARGHQAKIFERKHIVPITTFGRKYIPASGGGGYAPVNAEVTAWMNNVTTAGGTLSNAQGTRVDAMVSGLKTDLGISAMNAFFDRFWIFVAENTQQATYDLTGTSHAWTSFNGAGTFPLRWAATTGFTGDGTTNYINTGFNPATAGVNFTLNVGTLGVYCVNNRTTTNTSEAIGCSDTTNTVTLLPYSTDTGGTQVGYLNIAAGADTVIGAATTHGLTIDARYLSTTTSILNFVTASPSTGDSATTANAVPSQNIYIGCRNANGTAAHFSSDSIACVFISTAGTTAITTNSLMTLIAARINTYMSGAGAIWNW
jgi:hypothetical protein